MSSGTGQKVIYLHKSCPQMASIYGQLITRWIMLSL